MSDYVYLVENNDFESIYCVGYNPHSSGVGGATKGLNLTLLPNGNLFTTDGQIFEIDKLIKEYNYDDIEQGGKYPNASISNSIIIENKYSDGVKYSKDGIQWMPLIDNFKNIRNDTRYLWDIQFIVDESHAVGLFDTVAQGNFLAVFEQGQWNEVDSDTDVTRLLYVNDKLLGLNNKSIKILDSKTGVILNEFNVEGMRYTSIHNDRIVFTDGVENYQFNLDSLALNSHNAPVEIGFITSIEEHGESIYYGTSNGIWRNKNNEYEQLFKIDGDNGAGCFLRQY